MPGDLGCRGGNGNSDLPDLGEVAQEVICGVMDSHEALRNTAPLDVNRINSPANESKRAVRAKAVSNRESVEYCADVFGVEFGSARGQIHFRTAFRHRSCPER